MIKTEYFCPKCESNRVEVRRLASTESETRRVSMDDLDKEGAPRAHTLALRLYTWKATCKDCNYEKEFTLPAGSGFLESHPGEVMCVTCNVACEGVAPSLMSLKVCPNCNGVYKE